MDRFRVRTLGMFLTSLETPSPPKRARLPPWEARRVGVPARQCRVTSAHEGNFRPLSAFSGKDQLEHEAVLIHFLEGAMGSPFAVFQANRRQFLARSPVIRGMDASNP